MKVFLIGMPGSGKTTLGRQVADRLKMEFVDLDEQIEKEQGRSISEIFAADGHDHFRLIESRLLHQWATGDQSFVMATGGGAPCFHDGIAVINANGVSVFLDCPVAVLFERVKSNRERPLLRAEDEREIMHRLETMRAERLACYQQARLVLDTASPDALVEYLDRLKK